MSPPLSPVRSVSVLVPTFQGAEFLERVLDALAAQECDLPWDLSVVDSGSTDGTLELLRARREAFPVPLSVRTIHPLEFDHGDTRNALAAESRGDLLVFLTQDAIPRGAGWLAALAANFDDERVAAAYCRNVPRPDADPATVLLSSQDPGYAPGRREVRLPPAEEYARLDAHERRLLYNFNDVASAIRREVWRRHPFPRTWFGEDLLMARAILEAGYTVVYDDVAVVEHSHDYTPEEVLARARVDGRFNAEWLDRICVASRSDAETLRRRFAETDAAAIEEAGLAEREALARRLDELRAATFLGLHEGGAAAGERRPATRLGEERPLRVLYVVHSFPPETWAGTEVYTLQLAQEVQRLGHEVTVLCRAADEVPEEEGGRAEYALREETFQDLRVLRMTHRLDFDGMRASYANGEVERVFDALLERERPDLVHFQHLIHFSAGLVRVVQDRGLPAVITCNDYWALCARVQLIRPDGVRCPENQGLGCLVCVKEKEYARIPLARRWLPLAEPLVLGGGGLAVRLMQPPSVKVTRFFHDPRVVLARRLRSWRDLRERQPYVEGMYARADLLVAPSRFLRERFLATGRFDPHRFVYSDYGLRTDHLRALEKTPAPGGRLRLGYVGSLVWYKGVDVLVRAMAELSGVPVELAVHGDFRPEEEPHHAELRDLAAGSAVTFQGRFSNEALAEVYRDIDVLVVPSVWYENSPITIHEAFALETPVVTSDIGGMAELVTDGVDGRHFRAGDAADLARVLRELAEDPAALEALRGHWPRVKTIEEDARAMEFRYRALTCVVRS